ncbi:MAG: helix-hairpin-helix domain-containing protein [Anaerolineae bacterium]|nr:helix-hairpin-helix domain-containing protein [Anaerolineae bacterium]
MKLDQSNVGWVITAFVLGLVFAMGGMTLFKQTQPAPIIISPPEPTPTAVPTETPGPVQVFVNGAVRQEAVYTLPAGSMVQDAIEAAGGFADDANVAVVNLAQPMFNGAQVYVPFNAENSATPTAVIFTEAESENGRGQQASLSAEGLVNINSADAAQLETLPGIGASTAQKIITFRDENGSFGTIEEIMNVPGIGEGKFEQLRTLITVDGN